MSLAPCVVISFSHQRVATFSWQLYGYLSCFLRARTLLCALTLPSCAHCLFNVDTVSIDGFISSLLDELDLCSLQWNNHACSNETITRCSSHLGSSGLDTRCSETCNIFKQGKLSEDTHNYPAAINLCYFTELISLLELFGIYMVWSSVISS